MNPKIEQAKVFFRQEIWQDDTELPRWKQILRKQLQILLLVWESLQRDNVFLRVYALTYVTLLSLIPLFAVMAFAFDGFGGTSALQGQLKKMLAGNLLPQTGDTVMQYIDQMVKQVNFGSLGIIGILGTIYTVLSMLNKIESNFNEIMHSRRERSVVFRFAIYWSMLTLGPLLLGGSLSLQATLFRSSVAESLAVFSWFSRFFVALTPLLLTILLFWLLYRFLPATPIRFLSALYGAVVASLIWEVAKRTYYVSLSGSFQMNKIYGTLVTLPITLIWIQVTWIIVLLGAVFVYVHQHHATLLRNKNRLLLSPQARERLTCQCALAIAWNFLHGKKPLTAEEIATKIGVPSEFLSETLLFLEKKGYLVELAGENRLQPARDPRTISLQEILVALREEGDHLPPYDREDPAEGRSQASLVSLLADGESLWRGHLGSLSLAALIETPPSGFRLSPPDDDEPLPLQAPEGA